jgi:hypothetical protein
LVKEVRGERAVDKVEGGAVRDESAKRLRRGAETPWRESVLESSAGGARRAWMRMMGSSLA